MLKHFFHRVVAIICLSASILCSCSSTNVQTEEGLSENFHHGIPKHEVMERTQASDITDLLCYKGGYIFNKNSDTTSLPLLAPLNMLVMGEGKVNEYGNAILKLDSLTTFTTNLDHYSFELFPKRYQNNIEDNVLARADTQVDRSYGDRIITNQEIDAAKNDIIKKSYNGEFAVIDYFSD